MPETTEKAIPVSKFAELVGCSNKTIERYIDAGKIYGEALTVSPGGKPKVYYSKALPMYDAARENVATRFVRSGHTLDKPSAAPAAEPAKPKARAGKLSARQSQQMENLIALGSMSDFDRREKLEAYVAGEYDLPDSDVVEALLKEAGIKRARIKKPSAGDELLPAERRPQAHGGNLKSGQDRVNADVSGMETMSDEDLAALDPNALNKRVLILNIRQKEMEYRKAAGQLIDISTVDAALTSFGIIVRNRFEAMPDRIVDSLINAAMSGNRVKTKALLIGEINSALTILSESGGVINQIKTGRSK